MSGLSLTAESLHKAFEARDPSIRLAAAQAAGTFPSPEFVDVLVSQIPGETDFFVRDMITWALIHHDHRLVLDRVIPELKSDNAKSRAQALHTISKIQDPATWPLVTVSLILDEDDLVAQTAWRTAVRLVPEREKAALAKVLATQFGRGSVEVQLGLSRALIDLGHVAKHLIARAAKSKDESVSRHALATQALALHPEQTSHFATQVAKRRTLLQGAPLVDPDLVE